MLDIVFQSIQDCHIFLEKLPLFGKGNFYLVMARIKGAKGIPFFFFAAL
jgi:hypothetical protein